MIEKHIASLIRENIDFTPTTGQDNFIAAVSEFIATPGNNDVLMINGYAGTGKTTMLSALVKVLPTLKLSHVLMAPTGRAAKVISGYTGTQAFTIHKKIYRQKSSKDGFGEFSLDRNMKSSTFFIVDEASMISGQSLDAAIFGSGNLLDDLISYVYNNRNCKLIICGDMAQLPPVGLDISPALDRKSLEGYGYRVKDLFLNEVVRQAENSGILYNATLIRELISDHRIVFPKFRLDGFDDIQAITGTDLVEVISSAYDKYGIEDTIVVCRSNKRANRFNEGIRNQILWREEEIATGDLLMVVKNNYFWLKDNEHIDFIANGDIAEIVQIKKYDNRYGFRFADVIIRFIDYPDVELETKIILDTLSIESASLTSKQNKEMFYAVMEDYADLKTKKKIYQAVKDDPFFNALQVKFAYAVTCHKAQGGQWKAVFIDVGYVTEDMISVEYLRWLYTAVSRATEKLYLVNFPAMFFNE